MTKILTSAVFRPIVAIFTLTAGLLVIVAAFGHLQLNAQADVFSQFALDRSRLLNRTLQLDAALTRQQLAAQRAMLATQAREVDAELAELEAQRAAARRAGDALAPLLKDAELPREWLDTITAAGRDHGRTMDEFLSFARSGDLQHGAGSLGSRLDADHAWYAQSIRLLMEQQTRMLQAVPVMLGAERDLSNRAAAGMVLATLAIAALAMFIVLRTLMQLLGRAEAVVLQATNQARQAELLVTSHAEISQMLTTLAESMGSASEATQRLRGIAQQVAATASRSARDPGVLPHS
jgi:hypothetical protein